MISHGIISVIDDIFQHTVVTQEAVDICEDIAQSRDGKFRYLIGKTTPSMSRLIIVNFNKKMLFFVEILQSNSASDCYLKNNHELLNKLRTNAIKLKSLTF